jgi:molybdate transport system substrate-binding protein
MLLALAACGSDGASSSSSPSTTKVSGTVTVFAAASLQAGLEEVASAFEADHPGVEVRTVFDGSSKLATQLLDGAPADVFLSADEASAAKVVDGGLATGAGRTLLHNRLQIVVPKGNPAGIASLADLGRRGLKIALCAPQVACGSYAARAFANANLPVPAASQEENVKAVLTKVQLGEADAGIVYVTDVLAARDAVVGVDVPDDQNVVASYPVVELRSAPNRAAAVLFIASLRSSAARAIFARLGFDVP